MTIDTDPEDLDFQRQLEAMIDYSKEDMTAALDAMSAAKMMDLMDAVADEDKVGVSEIMTKALEKSKNTTVESRSTKPVKDKATQMTDKKMPKTISEMIMGMGAINSTGLGDDLTRMRALAGMSGATVDAPNSDATVEVEEIPDQEPADTDNPCETVMAALDAIEQNIEGIVLQDLKTVRQRLNAINMKMNEGILDKRVHNLDGTRKRK